MTVHSRSIELLQSHLHFLSPDKQAVVDRVEGGRETRDAAPDDEDLGLDFVLTPGHGLL